MFGIESYSDILIIAIFVQMAIIAVLIFTIFFRINRAYHTPASTPKYTELDKKVDKKLTGIQIRLGEILTEVSIATQEQKESISKIAAIVASDVNDRKSETTGSLTTTSNRFPITNDISFLAKMERFAPSSTNVNNATAPTIHTNPSRFVSELFDSSDDSPIPKSEFLEIDLDHDSMVDDPNKEPDTLGSGLKKASDVVHTPMNGLPDDAPASIKSSDFASRHNPIAHPSSRHYFHPQSPNHLKRRLQPFDYALTESSIVGEYADEMMPGLKENDIAQNQNYQKIEDSGSEKLDVSTEKNSNPELDKIDKEILTALKRLGGMDSSNENDNKENDSGSSKKEEIE